MKTNKKNHNLTGVIIIAIGAYFFASIVSVNFNPLYWHIMAKLMYPMAVLWGYIFLKLLKINA